MQDFMLKLYGHYAVWHSIIPSSQKVLKDGSAEAPPPPQKRKHLAVV